MKTLDDYKALFGPEVLERLLPGQLSDDFFEALLGDARDGAYDIRLAFKGADRHQLDFELQLHRRPGKCLACSLTYGLPKVLARHPVINLAGLVEKICQQLDGQTVCRQWRLGRTQEISKDLHVIGLVVELSQQPS